jgi:osmotically-inducible protein OsmY
MKKLFLLVVLGAVIAWLRSGRKTPSIDRVRGLAPDLDRVRDIAPDLARVRDLAPDLSRVRDAVPGLGGADVRDDATLAGGVEDAAIAHRVETELFRSDDVPKGQINVNVEYGKVVLRGEVGSREMIDDLVRRTFEIEGVTDVENLLHTPGEAAPMHE